MRSLNFALLLTLAAQAGMFSAAIAADDGVIATDLIKRGESAAAVGDWRAAVADFTRASEVPESKKTAMYDLGVAYYHLGEFAKGLSAERAATDADPKFVPAYVQISTILTKMGDIAGAESALNKAHEIDPDSKLVQQNLLQLKGLVSTIKHPVTADAIAAIKIFDGSAKQPDLRGVTGGSPDKTITIEIPTKEAATPSTTSSNGEVVIKAVPAAQTAAKAVSAGGDEIQRWRTLSPAKSVVSVPTTETAAIKDSTPKEVAKAPAAEEVLADAAAKQLDFKLHNTVPETGATVG
ncbi:MAG: tetratricopeptide repeat protein, partial [Terriglobales bacterium]